MKNNYSDRSGRALLLTRVACFHVENRDPFQHEFYGAWEFEEFRVCVVCCIVRMSELCAFFRINEAAVRGMSDLSGCKRVVL